MTLLCGQHPPPKHIRRDLTAREAYLMFTFADIENVELKVDYASNDLPRLLASHWLNFILGWDLGVVDGRQLWT